MSARREDLWLFGYGSLVWRPDFPYEERRPGYIIGWARRFWQASPDHRGVPEAPGRVVTLQATAGSTCWGSAYRLSAQQRDDVLAALDVREQGGYVRHRTKIHLHDGRDVAGLLYVATHDNEHYLGPAPLHEMVDQIRASHGPSGSNLEYVLRLYEALREMGAVDTHVFEVARALGAE